MGKKVEEYIKLAYNNLYEWYEYINNKEDAANEDVTKYSDKFYQTVEGFCREDKYNLKNAAYAIVNKHRDTIDLIQKDSSQNIDNQKNAVEEVPFIKYPKSEDESAIIDLFFGYKRGKENISDTEYFRNITKPEFQNGKFVYANYQKILKYVIQWRIYIDLEETNGKDFFIELCDDMVKQSEAIGEDKWKDLKKRHNSSLKDLVKKYKELDYQKNDAEFKYFDFENEKVTSVSDTEDDIQKQLSGLNRESPIPIIPYYVELLLNNFIPVNHIVIPISYSSLYRYPIQNASSNISTLLVATRNEAEGDTTTDVIRDIQMFFSIVGTPIIDQYFYGNVIKAALISESIKSARSAIMARNISHNLGSHVMAYIKQYLLSVKSIVDGDLVLRDLIKMADKTDNSDQWLEEIKAKLENKDNKLEFPFLVGLGRFISYLQERMDFIATVCTDYIPYFSTVNFKDSIYDELCLDACDCRHKHERRGEKPDNLLLKYIARSERLDREIEIETESENYKPNSIVIKFGKFNGMNDLKDRKAGTEKESNHGEGYDDLKRMRDINFSLPGGVTGRQAFCSIIENIIRNAAKHGGRLNNQNLELTIDIFDKSNLMKSSLKTDYENYEDIKNDDLYVITITDNLPLKKGDDGKCIAIETLKDTIKENYIDSTGRMLETGKGIKEMRISAAWLRSIKDEDEHKKTNNAPILDVRDNSEYLQYVFCILKPKNIAFVKNNLTSEDTEVQNVLKESHCKLYSVENFKTATKINYQFVVAVENGVFEKILPYSHSRTLECLDYEYKTINKGNIDDKLLDLYKQFVPYTEKIFISDSKGRNKIIENINNKYVIRKDEADDITIKYLYKNHFSGEGEGEFVKFMQKYYDEIDSFKFIESITGHNSTDRLVRNEEINSLWYYRHLNAMHTSVAIFDERLFDKVTGLKIGDEDWWSKIINNKESTFEEKKKEILEQDEKHSNIIKSNSNSSTIFEYLEEDKLNTFIQTYFIENPVAVAKTRQPYLYYLKNIQFFNLHWNYSEETFDIFGFSQVLHEVKDEKYFYNGAEYKKIGRIFPKRNDKKEITAIIVDVASHTKFNYLSIHQGLLDKIYEKFEIAKNKSTDRFKVTKAIYDSLCMKKLEKNPVRVKDTDVDYKFDGEENVEFYYEFLPNFVIHSGRSKPAKEDMPQQQPFVQYAALENAVVDCKYTLVELLNSARYEQ